MNGEKSLKLADRPAMKAADRLRMDSLELRIESLRRSLEILEKTMVNFDTLGPGQLKAVNELAMSMRQRLQETWKERTALLNQREA